MTRRFALGSLIAGGLVLGMGCGGSPRHYNPSLLDRLPERGSAEVPQSCGPDAGFGGVHVGALVVLRRHRAVEGDRNWIASMRRHRGRITRVISRAGRDPLGCPVVTVAADHGRHAWRVRDLTLIGRGEGPGGSDAVPQRCAQTEDALDIGLIQPGARVVLWRHREVEAENNWTDEMDQYVEQVAEVIRVGSVDAEGCPVFHVDLDEGEWAWRVRDVTLVEAALPQQCRRRGESVGHGALTVGARVRLAHHRPVNGDRGWTASMEQYVDRSAEVTSLGPPDDQGCPVVHVDVDQGARSWRVRDLVILGPEGSGAPSSRDDAPERAAPGQIPQACGQGTGPVAYGPIREGTQVVLGRHRAVGGDANWSEEMSAFVGREATVRRLSGADAAGCPGVRVDVDDGAFFWRIRDFSFPNDTL